MSDRSKSCGRCHKEFPATLEFFYKNALSRTGLNNWCKPCVNVRNSELDKRKKPLRRCLKCEQLVPNNKHKYCLDCKKKRRYTNCSVCNTLLTGKQRQRCAPCNREAGRKYVALVKERGATAFLKKMSELQSARYWTQPERYREYAKKDRQKLRAEFLEAYGKICACCGENEEAFLTLEHVKRDGASHRKKYRDSSSVLRDLRRRGWPKEDYEILCFNCNRASWELGVCPHRRKSA